MMDMMEAIPEPPPIHTIGRCSLRRKNSAAERAEPFDRIASAGLREQPLRERAIGFALHRKGRLLHSPRMIDHRITAETGDMRRPHHNELPGVELERWIELDQ